LLCYVAYMPRPLLFGLDLQFAFTELASPLFREQPFLRTSCDGIG